MSIVLNVLGTVMIMVAGAMVDRASDSRGGERWLLYSGVILLCVIGVLLHRWSFVLEGV